MKRAVVIGVAAAMVALAARAPAAPPASAALLADSGDRAPRARAVDLFKRSREAYRDKRYAEAVTLLLEARSLAREPVLLYNLARAYEGLEDLDRALAAYEEYLREDPGARDRSAIEEKMTGLRRQIAERAAREQNAARPADGTGARASEPAVPPPPARGMSILPFVVAGTGLVAIAAGASCGLIANEAHAQAKADSSAEEASSSQSKAESFATAANVAFIAGGLLTAAGVVWTVLELRSADRAAQAGRAGVRLGLGGVSLEGRF